MHQFFLKRYATAANFFHCREKVFDITVRYLGDKARRELGWKPKRIGLLHEIDLYYRAFKAQQASIIQQ
jgi:nucleoside-diphosphate-sugar epimerase